MGESGTETGHAAARAMLDIFASAGATGFDVTWTTADGKPQRYEEGISLAELPAECLTCWTARPPSSAT